jgi:hypothetical protein
MIDGSRMSLSRMEYADFESIFPCLFLECFENRVVGYIQFVIVGQGSGMVCGV